MYNGLILPFLASLMEHDYRSMNIASSPIIIPLDPSFGNKTPRTRACNTTIVSCGGCKCLSINTLKIPTMDPLTELRDIIGFPSKYPNGKFQLKSWFSPLTKKSPKKKPSYIPNKEVHSVIPNIMDDWDITIEGLNHKLIQTILRRDIALT